MYSGHDTTSVNCCIKYSIETQQKFEMIDTKNSSTTYVVMYKLIT